MSADLTDLTNEQWAIVSRLLPPDDVIGKKGGRLRRPNRDVLNGFSWVLRTGAPWNDMLDRSPAQRYVPPGGPKGELGGSF